MEVINKIFDLLAANIDFAFMFSVNVLTFLLIKKADEINKRKTSVTLYEATDYIIFRGCISSAVGTFGWLRIKGSTVFIHSIAC